MFDLRTRLNAIQRRSLPLRTNIEHASNIEAADTNYRQGDNSTPRTHARYTHERRFNILKELFIWGISPVLLVISLVYLHHGDNLKDISTNEILISLISYILAQHVAFYFIEKERQDFESHTTDLTLDKIDSTKAEFIRELGSSFRVIHIPEADVADKIITSLASAKNVRNTAIHISDMVGINTRQFNNVIKIYESFLQGKDSGTWHDIVAVSDFLDGRYQTISPRVGPDMPGLHRISVLTTSMPAVNFILFGKGEQEFSEVYFGWISNAAENVEIYYSSAGPLVSIFNNYFIQLLNSTRPNDIIVDYRRAGRNRFSDETITRIGGIWLGTSQSRNTKSGNAEERVGRNYSIIEIKCHNRWNVKGTIYSIDKHEYLYEFLSAESVIIEDELFYKYTKKDDRSGVKGGGIGSYTLVKQARRTVMHGFYADSDKPEKRLTRAVKLTPAEADMLRAIDQKLEDEGEDLAVWLNEKSILIQAKLDELFKSGSS